MSSIYNNLCVEWMCVVVVVFSASRLESSPAVGAHTFAHGQTAQDSDGKEEYGQEDGTTAVLFG